MSDQAMGALAEPLGPAPEEPRPIHMRRMPPREWVAKNLFNSRMNTVITLVMGSVLLSVGYRFLRWLFVTADWEAVQRFLTLFMRGNFPADEVWRLYTSTVLIGAVVGMVAGTLAASARDRAAETGEPLERSSVAEVLRRFWPLLLLLASLLIAARTIGPVLFAAAVIATGVVTRLLFGLLPKSLRGIAWGVALITGFAALQVLSGTGGIAYLGPGIVLAIGAYQLVEDRTVTLPRVLTWLIRAAALAAGFGLSWAVYQLPILDFDSVPWSRWAGLHLTLFVTVFVITLAFPIGVLMALGRRSSFPAFRVLTVAYIEFIRGVPLITLLLTAQFFIGFFISVSTSLDLLTKAIIAMVMFTAAYIAEIVRGGLQSVPRGQIEAGQAMGLSPLKVTRLIVMPQALRAVIPAMVGQFISLFKDTSLLFVIGITEFLGVRNNVHNAAEFRIGAHDVTLFFVAFVYWAVAYTMSRESRRLETKLGIGTR